jgi:cytochrome c oxidase cbb3-type subunit III
MQKSVSRGRLRRAVWTLIGRALIVCGAASGLARGQTSAEAGGQLFSATCAGCHGLDGHGGEHAANIATNANVERMADAELERIVRNGIPASGMPEFGSKLSDGQIASVVRYLRTLQGKGQAGVPAGDVGRGRALFFGSAGCSGCHMVAGAGGFLGSDLSGYGKAHSAEAIREAIVAPDKNLDPRRAAIVVVMRAGRRYEGVLRNEDNFSVQMQTSDGSFHLFEKRELAKVEHEERSPMPGDYGTRLSERELKDLVGFLASAPGTAAAADDKDDDQ